MNPKDIKCRCIWVYCNEECKCSECGNCPKYLPGYANRNDLKTEKEVLQ